MVGDEHDHRVVEHAFGGQQPHDLVELSVHALDGASVRGAILLGRARRGHARPAVGPVRKRQVDRDQRGCGYGEFAIEPRDEVVRIVGNVRGAVRMI
jgi:hypothetical protein